eukprot:scaffold1122_cov230-Pinguiococcus_pyrenoidosus.AAC.1
MRCPPACCRPRRSQGTGRSWRRRRQAAHWQPRRWTRRQPPRFCWGSHRPRRPPRTGWTRRRSHRSRQRTGLRRRPARAPCVAPSGW